MDIVDRDKILNGESTDAYFKRTREALDFLDENPHVVAEVTESQYAEGPYKVFSGVNDVAELFEGVNVDVLCLEEGRLFNGGPVMRIEGKYKEFLEYETSLLGLLSDHSGKATAALKVRKAAPESPVLSFGSRHVHPSIGLMIEKNAMLAGLDGFSLVSAEEELDMDASGTMPHALVLSVGEQEKAWKAFNEGVDDDVPRIALCDTFTDEKDEVRRAVSELGDDLDGIRLDTTSSRRGDFRRIIMEVQDELDRLGRSDVDVFVSGGLGPEDLAELKDVADGFGVGGFISNADPLDFGLDIVEVDGVSTSKRGKRAGKKTVVRDEGHHISRDSERHLLKYLVRDGEIVKADLLRESISLLEEECETLGVDSPEDIA